MSWAGLRLAVMKVALPWWFAFVLVWRPPTQLDILSLDLFAVDGFLYRRAALAWLYGRNPWNETSSRSVLKASSFRSPTRKASSSSSQQWPSHPGSGGWLIEGQLTRLTGGAAAAARAVAEWRRYDRLRAVLVVTVPAATFAAWFVAVALIVRRPDTYLPGSPSWYANVGISGGPGTLFEYPAAGGLVAAYLALLGVGIVRIRRIAPELELYAALLLLLSLFLGRRESEARYALPAFPAFAGIALLLSGRRNLRYGLLIAAAGGQLALAMFVAGGGYAP